MNPYVAEALAALQAKGYNQQDAQAIIDRFLASNPNDEHRLFAALDLGTTAVTGQDLLAAARADADLANKAYVRNLIPSDQTVETFFHPQAAPSAAPATNWILIVAVLGAAAVGAYFLMRR